MSAGRQKGKKLCLVMAWSCPCDSVALYTAPLSINHIKTLENASISLCSAGWFKTARNYIKQKLQTGE